MAVLTYLYPRAPEALAFERLLPTARKQVRHIAVAEVTFARRKAPDWNDLTFCHPTVPDADMLFVVSRNTKRNVGELEQRYGNRKAFSVVRNASILIWAQHKAPLGLPLKRLRQSWDTFIELLSVMAEVSRAVIDSPEAERLFTPTEFRRHIGEHRTA